MAELDTQAMGPDAAILARGTVGDLLNVLRGCELGSLFLVAGQLVDAEIRTEPGGQLILDGSAAAAQVLDWVPRFSFYFTVPSMSARPIRIGGLEDSAAQHPVRDAQSRVRTGCAGRANTIHAGRSSHDASREPAHGPGHLRRSHARLHPPQPRWDHPPPLGPGGHTQYRAVFLSQQSHPRLRQGGLRLPRQLRGLPLPGCRGDRDKLRLRLIPRPLRRQARVPLLADSGGAVRRLYRVPATLGILPGRASYVIDRQGRVRHTFSAHFGVARHVQTALQVLLELAG